MLRLTVHTLLSSRSGASTNIWFPFEIDAPDMETVHDRLSRAGCIFGHRITTETSPGGERFVSKREPYILTAGVIGTIGPCHFGYVEADEVAA